MFEIVETINSKMSRIKNAGIKGEKKSTIFYFFFAAEAETRSKQILSFAAKGEKHFPRFFAAKFILFDFISFL